MSYFGEPLVGKQTWDEKVVSYRGFCSDGPSITFVGDEIWSSTPAP